MRTFEQQRLDLHVQMSGFRMKIYDNEAQDSIWAKLTEVYLEQLDRLWAFQSHVTGKTIGGAQGVITNQQILDGALIGASRFFPNLGYTPNPFNWTKLKPYRPRILDGFTSADNGTEVDAPDSLYYRLVEVRDLAVTLTDTGSITQVWSMLADMVSVDANYADIDLMDFQAFQTFRADDISSWAGEKSDIEVLSPTSAGADTVQYLEPRIARLEGIRPSLVAQITDLGNKEYVWINSRLHRSAGTLGMLSVYEQAIQSFEDDLELIEDKIAAFS